MKNPFRILPLLILLSVVAILAVILPAPAQTIWRAPAKPVPAGPYLTAVPALPRIAVAVTPARPIQLLDQPVGISLFNTGGVWLDNLEFIHGGGRDPASLTGQGFTGVDKNLTISFPTLGTLSLPTLQWVGGHINITNTSSLGTLALPALRHVGGNVVFQEIKPASLSLPELESIAGVFSTNECVLPPAVSLPKLQSAGGIRIAATQGLETLSLPALANTDSLAFNGASDLTTLSLPAIVAIGNLATNNTTPALESVTLGSTLKCVAWNISFFGAALDQASVDGILTRLAALDGTNGTTAWSGDHAVDLAGGTNSAPTFTGTTATSTSIVGNGTTATVTRAEHGYTTGDLITISGAVNAAFNGTWEITVADADTFTYPNDYNGTAGTQGTMKKAGNTTEGYYRKQQLERRGIIVTTN